MLACAPRRARTHIHTGYHLSSAGERPREKISEGRTGVWRKASEVIASCVGIIQQELDNLTHDDLDAIFLNIEVIAKVNEKFLGELHAGVQPALAIKAAAKQFKGCYTRYVNNYDAAEQHLNKLKASDKEKHRYLEVCKTHPDAHGLDLRSFLIQPVQRVPRYRMLLEDLLNHTEEGHPDEEPLRDALEKVKEVAAHINEDKRKAEDVEKLNAMVARFTPDSGMDRELVRYDRRFLREGDLTKARLQRRQKRHCFLFNDLLLYTVSTAKGFQVKGKISLGVDARVEMLPDTETMTNAFAVIEKGGKGYTWLTDSAEETKEQKEIFQTTGGGAIRQGHRLGGNLPRGAGGPVDGHGVGGYVNFICKKYFCLGYRAQKK